MIARATRTIAPTTAATPIPIPAPVLSPLLLSPPLVPAAVDAAGETEIEVVGAAVDLGSMLVVGAEVGASAP